eukprot:CAMPEP_0205874784 /NCGR_PEP_ID=MMETSP1083-20121108/12902_1 /ASSEMBLY_ACC=CAM_ASM_000430 /TAXON_ID=97485 /ORGANISM="Prymnesium parvum, Strain Texoma1" /LENGTH=104 /DNA_ID=CAMNT_0053237407 /DNA_START=494 /DNA_END=807 /DNA_ORIENTATION=-
MNARKNVQAPSYQPPKKAATNLKRERASDYGDPVTTNSSIISKRELPGKKRVTYDPLSPQLTVNGPTVAGATSVLPGWHRDAADPGSSVGSPAAVATHTWYTPS